MAAIEATVPATCVDALPYRYLRQWWCTLRGWWRQKGLSWAELAMTGHLALQSMASSLAFLNSPLRHLEKVTMQAVSSPILGVGLHQISTPISAVTKQELVSLSKECVYKTTLRKGCWLEEERPSIKDFSQSSRFRWVQQDAMISQWAPKSSHMLYQIMNYCPFSRSYTLHQPVQIWRILYLTYYVHLSQ